MKELKDKNKIIFSIVVCTYNREKSIQKCLDSLMRLDFPKGKFEIIVIDDGSTDSTIAIAKSYPIKLIAHDKNKGISAARNTGLKHAKGEIYICFDDDCNVSTDWLKNLSLAYNKFNRKKISGIAGFIQLKKSGGLIEKYMDETGYANPSPVYYVKSTNIFSRFLSYLKNMFSPSIETKERIFEVGEIWGANCSFPVEVLKAIDGWDENLSGVEDTDLCDRIKKRFPNKKFICTKNAILFHDHELSLKAFFLKPYSRGKAILNFYLNNAKIPPIFPFPLAIIILAILFFILNPLSIVFSFILLPHIFYSWWIIKAIKKRKLYFVVFSYLQAGYELFSVLGLLKGYIKTI